MEFRSNTGFFIPDPFHRTLKNQFSFTLRYNSTTIFSDLTYGWETLKSQEDNQQGRGFQVEEAMVGGGSKFSRNSDPVTPPAISEVGNPDEEVGLQTPTLSNIVEFYSIPATSELYPPANEDGNPDELGLQSPTQANIGEFNSILAATGASLVGNPDELGLQTPTQATVPTVEESSSAEFKKKRKREVKRSSLKPGYVEGAERPEWLPDGWEMVRKLRKNGGSAGAIDTVYYEPVTGRGTGHLFRSKGEVLEFLETGTRRKRKSKPRDNNGKLPVS